MSRHETFEKLKASGGLPTPANIAFELLQISRSDTASLSDIAAIVEKDPALSGRLLKYANSAAVNSGRSVIAISDATVKLGMNVVTRLVLGFSLMINNKSGRCGSFDYPKFWNHALATATAIRVFSARKQSFNPDELFTCGLLSQIGRLGLASVFPKEYSIILDTAQNQPQLTEMELSSFAITHKDLTEEILIDWGIPEDLVTGIVSHDQLDQVQLHDVRLINFAKLLFLSSQLAEFYTSKEQSKDSLNRLTKLAHTLEIAVQDFAGLFDEIYEQWRSWAKLFECDVPELPSFQELSQTQQLLLNQYSDTTPHSSRFRILIIDDEPLTLKMIETLLVNAGHSVDTAKNGKEGVKRALETQPDMIITDMRMPEMDGIELCKVLRQTRFAKRIYIIMLTASESDQSLVASLEAGANDFLVKPFQPKVLEARVQNGLRLMEQQVVIERDRETIRKFAAELSTANRRLEQLAMTDSLTDLPNRRYAMDQLKQYWANTDRSNNSICCILIDIDYFKNVNDTYGHDCGDWVLQEIAKVLRKSVSKDDVVARLGGEEFLIINQNTTLEISKRLAEQIRRTFAQHAINYKEAVIQVTISLGIAINTSSMKDHNELIKAADDALYHSKRQGRNRVSVAETGKTIATSEYKTNKRPFLRNRKVL